MSTLYTIRHAQASFGKADYDRLSDLGEKQAHVLAVHLQQTVSGFDSVYSGKQLRHAQTLEAYEKVCAKEKNAFPPVKKTDAFNEYDAEKILRTVIPILIKEEPAFEADVARMLTDNRCFQKVFEKAMMKWGENNARFDGLETSESFADRVYQGIQDIILKEGSGKKVAVFTSGGCISAVIQKTLGLSNEDTLKLSWQIVNTSVTRFKYSGNRLMLFGFNEFAHLELTNDKKLITYR